MLAGAAMAPVVFAPAGIDQAVRVAAQRDLGGQHNLESISVIAPFALTAAVSTAYGASLLTDDCYMQSFTSRAVVAMAVSTTIVTGLKFVVGRNYLAWYTPPNEERTAVDRSTGFAPLTHLGAWPSGHAAATFAFAAVVREQLGLRNACQYGVCFVGYALAGSVSAAMILGDHHWLSDIVSGALIGEAVGRSMGAPDAKPSNRAWALVPVANGASLVGTF